MTRKRSLPAEMTDNRDLNAWLTYLETLHPRKIDLGLERVSTVARRLRLLPCRIPVLTVAGTNGKGTVVRCATALLVAGGCRVGTYTSPHLVRYNERICVDGLPVPDAMIVSAFIAIDEARGEISLSYFEFATLAALYVFREQEVDVAVLEVGLGGRLDAVNAVDATVSVITHIALDHQKWLGNTREAIAAEKAGIVREARPVVLAESDYPASLYGVIGERSAVAHRAGVEWQWQRLAGQRLEVTLANGQTRQVELPAGLQPSNVAAALCAVGLLGIDIPQASAEQALDGLLFPGRQQHLKIQGLDVIFDVAHNPDAAQALAAHLAKLPVAETLAVVGILGDKDVKGVIEPLAPHLSGAMVCGLPDTSRSISPDTLSAIVSAAGVKVIGEAESPMQAWHRLLENLHPDIGRVVVFGSFHTVGGIMSGLPGTGVAGDLENTWKPL
ncbi:MAG: bifunctional tetrahydrofolate synthase/dihydrofolate synthase [Chromatocurvus sp.]